MENYLIIYYFKVLDNFNTCFKWLHEVEKINYIIIIMALFFPGFLLL